MYLQTMYLKTIYSILPNKYSKQQQNKSNKTIN